MHVVFHGGRGMQGTTQAFHPPPMRLTRDIAKFALKPESLEAKGEMNNWAARLPDALCCPVSLNCLTFCSLGRLLLIEGEMAQLLPQLSFTRRRGPTTKATLKSTHWLPVS